jgi:hypothetical protein
MAMKIGDAKGTPQSGDRILITGDHPDNGKAYQIKELRENGWILTTNHRLFHEEFFELCPLPNSTFVAGWARVSHFQALSQEALNSSDSVRLTSIAQTSYQSDSPVLPITEMCEISQSEILDDNGETSTSLVVVHPVSRLVCKENAREEMTQETVYPPSSERSQPCNPNSSVSKTSQDCSVVPKTLKALGYISELSSISFPKSGTMRNGLLYQADTLAAPSLEKGYCWLESPGALSSGQGRPPGQSRLEGQLKKLGVLERKEVLNPLYLEKAYSLPLNWTNPQELKAATELLGIDEKPSEMHSIQEWPALPSEEFSICPSCASQIIRLSDGCGVCGLLLGVINNSPSNNDLSQELLGVSKNSPSKITNHLSPSNNSPSKSKRDWGEGNGYIEWRTITRNGKDYPQAYYHWKEGHKKRSKYIPKNLIERIVIADSQKRPVKEVLELLGVTLKPESESLLGVSKNSPSKSSNTLTPSNNSPSKTRRSKGEGSGSIHWKPCKRKDKATGQVIGEYLQPWYHYEIWEEGDRLVKKTTYIPQRLLSEIERLEEEKAPVKEILRVLNLKI